MSQGSLLEFPPPSAFGLPDQFQSWRPHQIEAWQTIVDATTPFVGINAPTGSGKSLIYMMAASLVGRTMVVTGGKGLQDQVGMDYAEMGIHDVRGQANYTCLAFEPGGEWQVLRPETQDECNCQNGPCHVGLTCTLRTAGCTYYDAVRQANKAKYGVTNYAWWIANKQHAKGLEGDLDLLVLDEAHVAGDELAKAVKIELPVWLCNVLGLKVLEGNHSIIDWQKWATYHANQFKAILDTKPVSSSPKALKYRQWQQKAERVLRTIGHMEVGDWVADHTAQAWVFECLNPAKYAQELLFQGAKKVVLTSATLTEKTMTLLGIKPEDITWFECPSHFPVARRPVIYVPTVRMSYKMVDSQWTQWIDRIDQILDGRPGVKGIIHTVSYSRAKRLYQNSTNQGRLLMPPPGQLDKYIHAFRGATAPVVLVSPAVMTGWDFPGNQCRFQIIAKLPFPDMTSEIMKARADVDKDYATYMMMQNLVQAVGRGMRSQDDWCETLIIDDQWGWVQAKYRKFAPTWFWDAVKKSITIPAPLKFAA